MFYFYKSIIFVPLFHSVYILLLLLHCFIILGIIIYLNNCFCLSSFVFLYFSLSSFFWNSLSFCVIVNFYWHQTIFFFFLVLSLEIPVYLHVLSCFCDLMGCILPGFSVHEILQEIIPEWIALLHCNPCPPPGDLLDPVTEPTSSVSPALAGRFFTTHTTWESPEVTICILQYLQS